ncbi:alpha/beta hydrolase [Williamsia deligens]|uniref:Alpha/beta hydrolase n=1 Tax=Williamsia deligens TaxID=321325 RepID=A0ABW3G155_9NOCA|nr:alpha/beta hydrolase [Williamsia deligens]MCP2195019.1 Acetyl esterase/lipase [Williamsia deligens]
MTTADVHPDLRRISRLLPHSPVRASTLPLVRVGIRLARPGARGVPTLNVGDGVSVRLHTPAAPRGDGSAMLWIHGGGYVMGSPAQDDALCAAFADRVGVTVAAVSYRFAPEHPYPAALDDCHTALRWLRARPQTDPAKTVVAGASAGGGLAAALSLRIRDADEVAPALQLLTYPMLDDRTRTASSPARAHRMWGAASNAYAWNAYLGTADPADAVPARHDDLSGVAPAWIGVGSTDLFYDEDLAYAQRLRDAGVACDVEVIPGAFHGFDSVAPRTPVARAFLATRARAVERALDGR